MKIVEIIPQLSSGGAERFVVDLSNELVSEGHEVHLIVLWPFKEKDFYVPQLDRRVNLISLNKKKGFDISIFRKLKKSIDRISPDVIHSHLRAINYLWPIALTNMSGKIYHTIHNDASKEATDLYGSIIRKFLFRYKKVNPITISAESHRSFKLYYGENTPATMILNGAPLIVANAANAVEVLDLKKKGKIVLLNIARVMPQKNQLALARAVEGMQNIHVLNIGFNETNEGREIESMKFRNFTMIGQRNNPRDYMAAADAFVLSSTYEGMPITLIECFSVGAIPICTPVGGVVNMISDGENGLLSRGVQQTDIENVIARFLSLSDDCRMKLQKNSHDSFPKYSIKACASNYLRLFTS